jgi:hypothetical protein
LPKELAALSVRDGQPPEGALEEEREYRLAARSARVGAATGKSTGRRAGIPLGVPTTRRSPEGAPKNVKDVY